MRAFLSSKQIMGESMYYIIEDNLITGRGETRRDALIAAGFKATVTVVRSGGRISWRGVIQRITPYSQITVADRTYCHPDDPYITKFNGAYRNEDEVLIPLWEEAYINLPRGIVVAST